VKNVGPKECDGGSPEFIAPSKQGRVVLRKAELRSDGRWSRLALKCVRMTSICHHLPRGAKEGGTEHHLHPEHRHPRHTRARLSCALASACGRRTKSGSAIEIGAQGTSPRVWRNERTPRAWRRERYSPPISSLPPLPSTFPHPPAVAHSPPPPFHLYGSSSSPSSLHTSEPTPSHHSKPPLPSLSPPSSYPFSSFFFPNLPPRPFLSPFATYPMSAAYLPPL